MKFEKHQKFAIRKFSVGVASVLIGQFFIRAVSNAPVVRASEVIGVHAEKQKDPDAEVAQPKVEATTVDTDTNHLVSTPKLDLTEAQSAEVEYKADDSIELGKRNEVITSTGEKIITIGTKPTTVVEEIPPIITYQEDKELEGGTTREEESLDSTHNGKISTITHTYNVNPTTGEVTDIQSEPVLTDSGKKGKIIHVGTKKLNRTETVYEYAFESDDSKEYTDEINLVYGEHRYDLTYEITFQYNPEKHLAEKNEKLIKTESVKSVLGNEVERTVLPDNNITTKIIKKNTGPKVSAPKTGKKRYQYIAQPEREAGESSIVKKAIPLIREKVDYYKLVDKYSGWVEHTHSEYRTKQEMEFGIVGIGTKPKIVYQEIPIYLKVDNKLVDSGKKLPVKTIVHYTLPENYEETEKLEEDITNEVLPFTVKKEESGKYSVHFDKEFEKPQVAEKPIYVADETLESGKRTETVDENGRKVIKIGTKAEEVVIEEIPPANIYIEDKNLDGGEIREEEITDSSRNGKIKSVKYTYEVNTETGELIMHESEPIIKDSGTKAKKVYVGTKTTRKVYSRENKLYVPDHTKSIFEPEPPVQLYVDNTNPIEVNYQYDPITHQAVITSWGNNLTEYNKLNLLGEIVYPINTKPDVESLPGVKRYKYVLNSDKEVGQMATLKESKPLIINEIWYKNEPIPNKTPDDEIHEIHERYEIKQEGEDGVIEIGSKPKVYTKTITVNVEQNGKIIQKEVQVKITIRYSLENEYSPKLIQTITAEMEPVEIEEPKVTSDKPKDFPTNEVPEYTGEVNSIEPPILELPSYTYRDTSSEEEDLPRKKEDNNHKQPVVYKENATENINREKQSTEKRVDDTVETSIQERIDNKSGLPNTGTEDNKSLASLGFLGLILGTSPLLKRKYK